jgi:hypothetical protein
MPFVAGKIYFKLNFKFNLNIFLIYPSGWGKTQEGGKSANVLQELQLPVLNNQQCQSDYAKINKVASDKQFDDAVICAGVREGGKDSCQGKYIYVHY